MALTVAISGNLSINQGDTTVLTAVVTGSDEPITYHWTAPRGSFQGATDQASATYRADFTDADDVDVIVTCSVASAANPNPTVSTGSLTAMTALGITGQVLNMYITETENTANGANTILYAEGSSDSALEAGSDDDLSGDLNIYRVSWRGSTDGFVLEDNTAGNLGDFFRNNTTQSVFVVFSDGTVYEITQAMFASGGVSWSRWNLTDAGIATKFDNLGADDTLLVGVGDAGSIGLDADTGSNTATVRVAAMMTPPPPPMGLPVISAVDPQTVIVDVDYELDVGITNIDVDDGDTVQVDGLLEGFYYNWNGDTNQVEIRGRTDRLIDEAIWAVKAENDAGMATGRITWKSIPSAPIIEEIGAQDIYRGVRTNIFLEVQNNPVIVNAEGLLTGLRYQPETRLVGGEPMPGLVIEGTIPYDAQQTVDAATFAVYAENLGGMDSYDMPVNIEDADEAVYVLDDQTDTLYRVSEAGALTWTFTGLGRPNKVYRPALAFLDGSVYALNETDNILYKVSASGVLDWSTSGLGTQPVFHISNDGSRVYTWNTLNPTLRCWSTAGDAATLLWTYSGFPAGNYRLFEVNLDGSVYCGDSSNRVIRKISADGSLLWMYSLPTISGTYFYKVHTDGSLYFYDANSRNLYKLNSNGFLVWTQMLTGLTFSTIDFFLELDSDGNLYMFFGGDVDTLLKKSPGGEEEWRYVMPLAGLTRRHGVTVGSDGSVYLILGSAGSTGAVFYKVSASGSLEWTLTGLNQGIAATTGPRNYLLPKLDNAGNIFLRHRSAGNLPTVYKVSPSGSLTWTYAGTSAILVTEDQFLVNSDGDVFLLTNAGVRKVSTTGSLDWTLASVEGEFVNFFGG